MEVSNSAQIVAPQKATKGKKAMRQVGNVALTTAAVGATVKGTRKLGGLILEKGRYNSKVNCKALHKHTIYDPFSGSPRLKRFAEKLKCCMSKVGNKLFPESKGWNKPFEALVKRNEGSITKEMLNTYKGSAALLIMGGIATIAVIAAGAFKAGKINGEGK